jgi:CBS domain-containing protein
MVTEKPGVLEALQLMRQHGVRHLPEVNAEGLLVGIVTADDLVEVIANALGALSKAVAKGQSREARSHR